MKFVILSILCSYITCTAQDDSIKKMFPGKWKMDSEKSEIYEEWIIVSDNEFNATSYFIKDGDKFVGEQIYIKKFAEFWCYVAVPESQYPTLFTLTEYTGKKFIFENKEHDFPQRIIYEFSQGGKLSAAIEGEVEGEIKRKEFSFTRVTN